MFRAKSCVALCVLLLVSVNLAVASGAARKAAEKAPGTISLNGKWNFVTDPSGTLTLKDLANEKKPREIVVPGSWEAQFSDLRDYAGVAWYWRTVQVGALQPKQVALLHFGAVDYRAVVYVNGQKVGSHDGGYLPFQFDVTSDLHPGENQIAVQVMDPSTNHGVVDGIHYTQIPHGKQGWYVQTGGLWQSVEMFIRPLVHLGVVHITAGANGTFTISAHVVDGSSAGAPTGTTVSAKMLNSEGKVVWQGKQSQSTGQDVYVFTGSLSNPSLWSPSHPSLYTLKVQTDSGDHRTYSFGFRTFTTRNGKFYLNGKVIYLRGALDQAFYPETIYTPPSLEYLKEEMMEAKAMGLNLLRCHMKVPDPRYLEAADETGMLVWYEIPYWDKLTPASETRAMKTLRGMVRRDWNHPSVVMVSIANESWGLNLNKATDRQWLLHAYHQAKKWVPGWLVDDNSACCSNFHMATDVADFHQYDSIPDHAADFDRFVDDFATRPGWLFSPHGDAQPKGDEPLVLSEFGNWGLPFVPKKRPWWFSRGFGNRKITMPAGFAKRFEEYQYKTLFPDLHALEAATQKHEYDSLKFEISSLRMHSAIQGYVITQLTNVMWESNGLMDMWRHPKNFASKLAALQQDDVVLIHPPKHNYYDHSVVKVPVYFSHYSQQNFSTVTINWNVEGTSLKGSFPASEIPVDAAAKVGTISFTVPHLSAPAREILSVEAVSGSTAISKTSVHLYFYPHETPSLPPPITFHDPRGSMRQLESTMEQRDYFVTSTSKAQPVMITPVFDATVKNALDSGTNVILLTSSPVNITPTLKVVPRSKGNLNGNWISNFAWIRKGEAPFKKIGFETFTGFDTESSTPEAVVEGVPPQDFKNVLAGEFYGWIHDNVGTVVQARYGKGRLLICTFALSTTYGTDPFATYLLDALVNYAASGFTPSFNITAQAH